ncbi:S1C family serine protease [Tuwongella immobilis]|uniref:PDZ domain-containing protein n=1 Tax=Tuwongella immobilis TaxID=692036 RepID=A0A6C2YQG9_9BACT|nr:trypsin-like peptidase domain-containing protein [Tuwongella immobilis]VIP03888.1 serine protease : Serine protease, HtrA/DegQ/DegS family OS=uncultured planctomycete GN=HGMM_F01A04C12 PE=4 SV=1: Trypsin_2: PDZ_2 [Tuwongella immobilis]VTS05143.1 serine protease : Serine protease, HtrA/DegQ/DegS family OS=uncultured planctomycete GN=HGMM_F01A04C12 PE=4 SV=1: Trypsin_2: PDZ_2 [Tuwongella immobilis]
MQQGTMRRGGVLGALLLGMLFPGLIHGQTAFDAVSNTVNSKLVKIYGSGGFKGVAGYGTGILISADGYILTAAGQLLDTSEPTIHLSDGRKMRAGIVVIEPELDSALLKLKPEPGDLLDLPFFDALAAAKRPLSQPGDWVLAFSNSFKIATRDEPMTVQRGVIAAYAKLTGRRGIFDAPYQGDVYVIDAITNNPGSAGGALTNRKGELLAIIGKELLNTQTDTWLNYAIPLQATVNVPTEDGKTTTVSMADFIERGMKGTYKPTPKREESIVNAGGYHGIVLVNDVVERTPPYVDEVLPESPGAKAGLRPDDLIVFVDGEPIATIKGFQDQMRRLRPGTTVRLEVRRGDSLLTKELLLVPQPQPAAPTTKQ